MQADIDLAVASTGRLIADTKLVAHTQLVEQLSGCPRRRSMAGGQEEPGYHRLTARPRACCRQVKNSGVVLRNFGEMGSA